MNYGPSNNLPYTPVVPARFAGDEPAVPDQNLDRIDRALPIPDGAGAVDTDLSRADGGLAPALHPVEQELCGILVRWFGRRFGWSSFAESFKEVDHCFLRPFVCLLR